MVAMIEAPFGTTAMALAGRTDGGLARGGAARW
jgi:hypothetical protein